ncbi:MAG: hypothetical protein E7584_01785, partial [Ruminococcaceae bacterium]|nr:hypothetical protein [Oscillospiraceae bacterium]
MILHNETRIVGSQAFANCKRLEKATLGESYRGTSETTEGIYSYNLFIDSLALEEIRVHEENENFANDSNGVLYSKNFDILYCYPAAIQRVTYNIPASVNKIYDSAFYGNTNIKRIVVGATRALSIGSRAFGNCTNLTAVYYVSSSVPVVAEKIYDNANASLTTYYKEEHSKAWGDENKNNDTLRRTWCERDIAAYQVVSEVPNSTVQTNDYLIYVKDTSNEAIQNAYVIVTVYTEDKIDVLGEDGETKSQTVKIPHKFYLYTDEYGRVSFSTEVDDKQIANDIHIYVHKESYFPYDYDLHLDEEMLITYLTISKEPDVFGVECEGVDINSQSKDINKAEYRDTSNVSYTNDQGVVTRVETIENYRNISITVLGFWDQVYEKPVFSLVQGEQTIVAEQTITENACTFTVSPGDLISDMPLEVVLSVTHKTLDPEDPGYELSCRKVLNINVIDFEIKEEDINLDFDASLDFDSMGNSSQLEIFKTLFGGDGFDIKLGEDVTFNTNITDSEVILTLSAAKEFKSKGSNYQKAYYEYYKPHGKGTYFYQFYDGFLTYNIRFVPTEVPDYFYYRLYVYHGLPGVNYSESLFKTEEGKAKATYGAFNLTSFETNLKGRAKVSARATTIFIHAKAWITETYLKDQNENSELIAKLIKGEIPIFDIEKAVSDITSPTEFKKFKPCFEEDYYPKQNTTKKNSHAFSVGFEGQLVFEYDKQGIRLASGSIKGTLEYTFKHNSQYVIWVIPVTLEVEVTVGGEILLKLKFDDGVTLEELEVTLKAKIEASVGVGCSVASIGLYGGIGAKFVLDILPTFALDEWEISGEFGAYVKVLWHKKKFEIWSGSIGSKEKTKTYAAYMMARKAAMYLADEDYVYTPDCAENATIVNLGGTYYKIYFAAAVDDNYDEYNCIKLCYSEWNNGSWSAPTIIDNNGYSDASYSLFEDNGNLYIAYTQQTKKLSAEEANDTYASAEGLSMKLIQFTNSLYAIDAGKTNDYTIVDGETTSDYKYAVQVATYNGSPAIVWAQNADNNIFGVSPDNSFDENTNTSHVYGTNANSIWVSYYDQENDEQITCPVAVGLSAIVDLEIYDGKVYYIVDEDGDLTDSSDCVMYEKSISADQTTLATKFNSTGFITSVEDNDGKLMYYYTDDQYEGLRINSSEELLPEATTMLGNGYVSVVDKNGNLAAILYTENQENENGSTSSRIMGMFREIVNEEEVWGKPICVYDANTQNIKNAQDDSKYIPLDIYISSFDAVFGENGQLILTMQLCNDEGSTYVDFEGITTYNTNDIQYAYTLQKDYLNQSLIFTVTNEGAKSFTVSVGGISQLVESGKTETIEIPSSEDILKQQYTLKFSNGLEEEIFETTEEISLEYVNLKPLAKQIVVGESNSLLIAIRNYGNVAATQGFKLYVIPGAIEETDKSGNEIASLIASIEPEQLEAKTIRSGGLVYYEVMLDESILGGSDGIVSLYIECDEEPEQAKADNLDAFYLSTISQTQKGSIKEPQEITPSASVSNDVFYLGGSDVEVTVIWNPGYKFELFAPEQEDKATEERLVDVYYDEKDTFFTHKLTIPATRLEKLGIGKHEFTVVITDVNSGETLDPITVTVTVSPLPVVDETEEIFYEVIWIIGETQKTTSVKNGEIPVPPPTPLPEGCTFIGWMDKDGRLITEGGTLNFAPVTGTDSENPPVYTAVIEKKTITHTITFVVWSKAQDSTLSTNTTHVLIVEDGAIPTAPEFFNKVRISGWMDADGNDVEITAATDDATYYAKYKVISGELKLFGSNSVGGTLITNALDIIDHDSFVYQWYVDGQRVEGATFATYTIRSEDRNKSIYCVVSGTDDYIGSLTSNVVTVSKHEHKMAYFAGIQATCEQNGNIEYWYCQTCDLYFADEDALQNISRSDIVIRAKGHQYDVTVIDPTCLADGYTRHTCTNCSHTYTSDITSKISHSMSEWSQTQAPTCVADGIERRDCANCEHFEVQTIAKLGHDFADTYTVDVEATCTNAGSKSRHCSRCDATTDVETIEKLAHEFGEWTQTQAPTCVADGIERRDCANCEHFEVQTIAKLGHDFADTYTVDVEATCTDAGSESRHCSRCDATTDVETIEKLAHQFGEWTQTQAPTCVADGIERRDCANCEHFEVQT